MNISLGSTGFQNIEEATAVLPLSLLQIDAKERHVEIERKRKCEVSTSRERSIRSSRFPRDSATLFIVQYLVLDTESARMRGGRRANKDERVRFGRRGEKKRDV